jgi:hypothetical protein
MCSAYRQILVLRIFPIVFGIVFVAPGIAVAAEFHCTLKDVVVFANRVHCQCAATTSDGSSNIRYFAVPTADAKLADRLLSVGTTALVSGRRFIAGYTNGDVSGNSFGCNANDCRRLTYFGLE